MALKIVKSSDPLKVERLNVVVYAQPGVGKTSIAFTTSNPLLLDFDGGAYRAAHRKDSVQVSAWSDVTGITADDLAPYSTVIVDTAGRALDMLSADIIKRDPKKGRGGVLSLQGYGALKAEFGACGPSAQAPIPPFPASPSSPSGRCADGHESRRSAPALSTRYTPARASNAGLGLKALTGCGRSSGDSREQYRHLFPPRGHRPLEIPHR